MEHGSGSQSGERPVRRLRAVPTTAMTHADADPAALPTVFERVPPRLVSDDDTPPRVEALDDLLRQVDALRSSVRLDLALAATAAEAHEPALSHFLLAGTGDRLDGFRASALAGLAAVDVEDAAAQPGARPARRRVWMLPKAPVAAAAAAVAMIAGGLLPGRSSAPPVTHQTSAVSSYHELTRLAAEGASAGEVLEAAEELHDRLAPLVAQAHTDPAAARQALVLLQGEQALLRESAPHAELRAVLREAQALVRQLRRALPRVPAAAPPQPVAVEQPREEGKPAKSAKPSPRPSASPKPTSAPKPTASPTPKPSSSPSSKPSPTPSQSAGPLPGMPDAPD